MYFMLLYNIKNEKMACKELMVKAADQLVKTISKQMLYGQQKETKIYQALARIQSLQFFWMN